MTRSVSCRSAGSMTVEVVMVEGAGGPMTMWVSVAKPMVYDATLPAGGHSAKWGSVILQRANGLLLAQLE